MQAMLDNLLARRKEWREIEPRASKSLISSSSCT